MTDDTTTTDSETDEQELKEVATGGDTATVDLQDLVDDLEAEVKRLRGLKKQAENDPDADVEWPPAEYATLDFPIRAVEHRKQLVEGDIEDFGGSQIVIRKARAGEAARATDISLSDAAKTDADPASQIASQEHRTVQVCVEQVPSDAPTTADGRLNTHAMELPTFRWLKNRVENFNTYGEVTLDDF